MSASLVGYRTRDVEECILLKSNYEYECRYEPTDEKQSVDTVYNWIECVRRKELFISFLTIRLLECMRGIYTPLETGMRRVGERSYTFTETTLKSIYDEFSTHSLEYLEDFVFLRRE
jgi:hypothetical protein